jgi:hypothetical protein
METICNLKLHMGRYKSVNKEESIKLNRSSSRDVCKKRNRNFVTDYLNSHPCVDCENTDIRVLEFDHINDDKEGNISHAVNNAWSIKRLTNEMGKCQVRCANCHRIKTIERRNQLFINQTKTT